MSKPPPHPQYVRYFNRFVSVNVGESDIADCEFNTVSGKVLDVNDKSMAIRVRSKTIIVEIKRIIGDVEIQNSITRGRVQRRRLLNPGRNVRPHLADRHGIEMRILNAIEEKTASDMHERIDHDLLGHRHDGQLDRHEAHPESPRVIVQRFVDDSDSSARQHMADRHGMPFKLLNAFSDSELQLMHTAVNHSRIAHRHTQTVEPAATPVIPRPRVSTEYTSNILDLDFMEGPSR